MGNSFSSEPDTIPRKRSKASLLSKKQITMGSKSVPKGINQISSENQKEIENSEPLHSRANKIAEDQEEIIIMSSVDDMVKHFVKESAIIWHDPNVHTPENAVYVTELKNICDIRVFVDWKDASEYLKKETQLSFCQVITSGNNEELFVKDISSLPLISSIYVFAGNIDYHTTWAKKYPKVVSVENKFEFLFEKIRQNIVTWQKTSSSLRVYLPSFAPIFDDMDLSEMNDLQFYLQGFINFTNRSQAKRDFLNLARALYGNNRFIEDFEKNYDQYDMKAILSWYTKECFLYKLTNNCLRIAKSDSIQYCRLLLKDLETAIKDKYQQTSHEFTGLLYRGAYLSDNEWSRLQQNIGRDIEMHGFLSTTKLKNVAPMFCQGDGDKKAIITIIIPNFPDKEIQGFAEMRDFTEFAGEEEVLFNVRSRFTVIESALEEINGVRIRHLVLLYGAQAMRKYTTVNNPFVEVEMNFENAECKVCKQKIDIEKESLIAVSICSPHDYICRNCMKQTHIASKEVLLCLSPSAYGLSSSSSDNNKTLNLKIEGTVMKYQNTLNIPFYGHKCVICKGTRLRSCYKCLDCKDAKVIYCNNCFPMNECLGKGHLIIVQGYPFAFWSQKMSKAEEHHLNYQQEQLDKIRDLFDQALIFLKTKNYGKAIEYFEKYLEKNGDKKDKMTGECYNTIGYSYATLGQYQKAIPYLMKALEVYKSVFGENIPEAASCYNNLGAAYDSLTEYHKAIEYYEKSLKIYESVFGDNHSDVANSYNNLGTAYLNLQEYQKALEYYYKSLGIFKTVLGDNHSLTATSYNNLGDSYCRLGEYQKAIEYSSKSLEIRKTVFGDNHPDTADSYNNLGSLYGKLGEYQRALQYLIKAIEIRKALFRDNHHVIANSYTNLGDLYCKSGDYQRALEYHFKALKINKEAFGDNHLEAAAPYNNVGEVYRHLGEYHKAKEYYFKALEIYKVVFGENDPKTAFFYNNLGLAYNGLGEYQKAIEYHSKFLRIFEPVLGHNHSNIATSYNNLGDCYKNLGEYHRAIEYFSKSHEIRKVVFGDNHLHIATTYNNLGLAYLSLGEYDKAIEYCFKAVEICNAALGDKHPHTVALYLNFESALQAQENSLKSY